jgi:hypothetical protein
MHARVATQIPDYPFSDSFLTEFSEVRGSNLPLSGRVLADRGGAMRVTTSGRRPLARTRMRYQGSWSYAGWRRKES